MQIVPHPLRRHDYAGGGAKSADDLPMIFVPFRGRRLTMHCDPPGQHIRMSDGDDRPCPVEPCLRIAINMHEVDRMLLGECVEPAAAGGDIVLAAGHPFEPKIALRQCYVAELGESRS